MQHLSSKAVAVILSGCGHKDGTELTEGASVLIALSEVNARIRIFAPDVTAPVRDPFTNELTGEMRHVLTEAARLARGHVEMLSNLNPDDFDAVVLPGGSGAATVLSDWATRGAAATVATDVARVVTAFHQQQKPILAICIAPTLIAKVLGKKGVSVTIGRDPVVAAEIEKTGAVHEPCAVDDFITDRDNRVITTPAYMYADATPFEVFTGIRKAVRELVEMA